MVLSAALRCSWLMPDRPCCSWPATPASPMNSPLASYTLMPSSSMRLCALSVGLASRWSMVLRLVPASLPIMPALANAASVPVVSCMLMPMLLDTKPAWFNARPRSWAEPTALPAPAASASATWVDSAPVRLNCLSVVAMSSAASPTAMPSDAARFSAPLKPPERISEVDRPALPSSLMASADSVAE